MKTGLKIVGGILQLVGGALCLYSGLALLTGSGGDFALTVIGLILIVVGNLMSKSKK
jgi:hypothetical protein